MSSSSSSPMNVAGASGVAPMAAASATPSSPSAPPTLPPTLLHRPSSRRSSSGVHRSPSLLPQPEPSMPQRFSTSSEEQSRLINALEAEEEALVNSLSRKLEKLRAEKVELESTLEMEQEQLVNRLQRQLSQLLASQQQGLTPNQTSSAATAPASLPASPGINELPLDPTSNLGHYSASSPIPRTNLAPLLMTSDPTRPAPAVVLEALQTENTSLRNKLAEAESSAFRATKMNEIYRQELIDLRTRAGLDIADLVNNVNLPDSYDVYNPSHPAASPGDSTTGTSNRSRRNSAARTGGTLASNGTVGGGTSIRIPGVSTSPPFNHTRSVSFSKSSYSPSLSSAVMSPGTPFSSTSPATNTTTPSTSYSTPLAPNSTPISTFVSLPSSTSSSVSSTPYGSVPSTSGMSSGGPGYRVPPPSLASSLGVDTLLSHPPSSYGLSTSPAAGFGGDYPGNSLQRRLSNSRHGARVAETGILKRRSSSVNQSMTEALGSSNGGTVVEQAEKEDKET